MDVLGIIFDEFDAKEMLSKLESNLDWKDKTEKNTMMTDKFRDKLKQLDPELLKEFDELEYLKTGLILFIVSILACHPNLEIRFRRLMRSKPWAAIAVNILLLCLSVAYMVYNSYTPFLYLKF